ncbi:MAG: hypothetical protein QOH82_2853 [Mycobacterium sp.]|nr:hypothetical protein [Mycobacterium sp.]
MRGDEASDQVVEHLGPQRRLTHHARADAEAGEVVVDAADHFVGEPVAEDGAGPPAVQCPGVLRQEGGSLDRHEAADVDTHPDQPSTLTARAMTRAIVVIDTSDCTVIMPLAQRASGIVSVGENATTLVKLT